MASVQASSNLNGRTWHAEIPVKESLAAAIVDLKAAAMAELTAFLAEAQVKEEEDIDMMEELAPGDDVADDEIQRMAVAGAGKGNAKGKKGIKRKGPP